MRSRRTALLLLEVLGVLLMVGGPASAQLAPSPRAVHHIHGLALDRRDPEVLYIATHTGLVRIRPGAAVEWIGSGFDLMGFTAHPTAANLVYASGHPDLATYQKQKVGNLGLLLSRDGGKTWQSVTLRGEADFHALAYSPGGGGALYGWSVAVQPGLYRISAVRWTVEPVPARGLSDVLALAASPDPAGPLLAGTKAGLMMSRDRGLTWARVPSVPADRPVTAVSYHPADGALVYAYVARADAGLVRSQDAGSTWAPTGFVTDVQVPVVALTVGPGGHVAVATSRSDVLRSRDGGRTWQAVLERGGPAAGVR